MIVEKNRMGGTCTTYGCDSKILLDAPFEILDQVARYDKKGIEGNLKINWKNLMDYKNKIINPLSQIAENSFKNTGIEIIKEKATFIDNHTIEAGGKKYTAENIVISTGQKPSKLNIKGKEYLHDSNNLLFEENFPKRITFIGAGIISLEFAAMTVKLGSEVNLIEFSGRALRQYHGEYVDKMIKKFESEGVKFYFNETVSEVVKNDNGFIVKVSSGTEIVTDYVIDATEEFEESQKVVKRIIELGGTPKFGFVELPIYSDVQEFLFSFCKDIEKGIAGLNEIAAKINDDFVTKNMIQEFILREKEHFDWVRQDVKLIELVGLENYMLE